MRLDLHTARHSAPSRLLPLGSRPTGEPAPASRSGARTKPGAGTRRRIRTVWGPRPPRPPPDHCPLGEGRGRVQILRGPRGSGPRAAPHPPTPPGAAPRPRPNAHAGGECADDKRGARVGNRGPPPRGGAGRPRRNPPPHPPHRPASRGGAGPHPPEAEGMVPPPPARERGRSTAHPPAPAAGSHRNRGEQASPRQRARKPHGPRPEKAGEHEPERYEIHAPHDQNDASDTRFVACPGKAEGRKEAERPPALLAPQVAQTGGAAHGPPPPPHPAAQHTNATDPPHGGRTAPSQVGGNRDRTAPPQARQTEQGTGAGQAEGHGPRGTALPAPSAGTSRGAHATPPRGGGADTAGARAHTDAKGTRILPEGQPDRARGTHRPRGMAYQRARVRHTRTRRPATSSAGHAGREGGNWRDTTPGTGPSPPNRPRAPRTHGRGTAPAKGVVAQCATPQPLG